MVMPNQLTLEIASGFADLALGNLVQEYPNHPGHVQIGPEDRGSHRHHHPIFFGCYDWHSAVHGYWLLAKVRRMFAALPQTRRIDEHFQRFITPDNSAAELAYFHLPHSRGFERPYGWAWLLMLCNELSKDAATAIFARHLAPLAELIRDRFVAFLNKAHLPMRVGTHGNIAFAMVLAHRYANDTGDAEFLDAMRNRARDWFGNDRDCQAWEPSLNDFLSPALSEARCMQQMLPGDEFQAWLRSFLPGLARREPVTLFQPAISPDRTDGQMAHLDGLNFSRAWCFKAIAQSFSSDDPTRSMLLETADEHIARSLPHISDDYMGGHWLGTFALLAME
jgi:hypothetical protein